MGKLHITEFKATSTTLASGRHIGQVWAYDGRHQIPVHTIEADTKGRAFRIAKRVADHKKRQAREAMLDLLQSL